MRTILLLATAATLGACGDMDTGDSRLDNREVVEPEDKTMVAVNKATYRLTDNDGRTFVTSYHGDGTVTSIDSTGETFAGTYEMRDGKLCLDWENDDYDDCYTAAYVEVGTTGSVVGDNAGDLMVNRIGYQETPEQPEAPADAQATETPAG